MTRRIVLVSHTAPTGEDTASRHLAARGFELEWTTPALGGTLPEPDETYAGAVVYGGPQPLTESARHAYLKDEMDWIGRWLAGAKPLLAICLGAQLLAHHLGARVAPHPEGLHEFGFYPLIPTPAGRGLFGEGLRVMQVHHHGFDLPRGARLLARSKAYPHQAFSWGDSAFGFLFHPEATPEGIARWHAILPELFAAPGAHSRARQEADLRRYGAPMAAWFEGFLDDLFGAPVGALEDSVLEQAAE